MEENCEAVSLNLATAHNSATHRKVIHGLLILINSLIEQLLAKNSKHDTQGAMQLNKINSYINLTWYKGNTQRKINHQATKFHISLHHDCSLLFQLWNIFLVTLDGILNFDFTQKNWRYPALELLQERHSVVFVALLCTLPVVLFPWVTILKIETQFLANGFSATATAYVRLASQTLHAPHVLGWILFSSEPAALIRTILTIKRSFLNSDCPNPCYLWRLMKNAVSGHWACERDRNLYFYGTEKEGSGFDWCKA